MTNEKKVIEVGHKLGDPACLRGQIFPKGNIVAVTNRGTRIKVRWPDESETEHHRKELKFP